MGMREDNLVVPVPVPTCAMPTNVPFRMLLTRRARVRGGSGETHVPMSSSVSPPGRPSTLPGDTLWCMKEATEAGS